MKLLKPLIRILGAYVVGNGVFMVVLPRHWYETIPGVGTAGPFNAHFIIDIGLVNISCGAFFLIGAERKLPILVVAGSIWPFFHAVFHVLGWLVHGIPEAPAFIATGIGVVFQAFAGFVCAMAIVRNPESLT